MPTFICSAVTVQAQTRNPLFRELIPLICDVFCQGTLATACAVFRLRRNHHHHHHHHHRHHHHHHHRHTHHYHHHHHHHFAPFFSKPCIHYRKGAKLRP